MKGGKSVRMNEIVRAIYTWSSILFFASLTFPTFHRNGEMGINGDKWGLEPHPLSYL